MWSLLSQVTGTRSEIKTDLASMVETVRLNTKIPAAIGLESPRRNRQRKWRRPPMA